MIVPKNNPIWTAKSPEPQYPLPYVRLVLVQTNYFLLLATRTLAWNHPPGDYWYDYLTPEEVGQMMGGN